MLSATQRKTIYTVQTEKPLQEELFYVLNWSWFPMKHRCFLHSVPFRDSKGIFGICCHML
jgi:hypothetical protein